jgi:hypothetical protein
MCGGRGIREVREKTEENHKKIYKKTSSTIASWNDSRVYSTNTGKKIPWAIFHKQLPFVY